jgi:hypothetical protein
MADASPGPGYWLASDGKWYPPQWEYNWVQKYHESSVTAVEMLGEASDQLGQQGWEMVSYTLQGTPSTPRFAFTASAMFKRRVIRS